MIRARYLIPLCLLVAACHGPVSSGHDTLQVWAHAGQAAERDILQAQVLRFNRTHPRDRVALTFIPENTYNAQVQAAALADELPDVLEFDGPYLANYAWQGQLAPLDELLPPSQLAALLPSIRTQGEYNGHLYGVGVFDSALGLYARRSALRSVGARVPRTPAQAWTIDEFETLLQRLARVDPDHKVLDLKLNYPPEWITYAFAPLLASAGGGLLAPDNHTAHGWLDGAASVMAMTHVQHWLRDGLVDANVDDAAFVSGRVALAFGGHWNYRNYATALGDDLLVLPLPDFGHGAKTGQGSWVWGVTRHGAKQPAAAAFLQFLLQTDEVLAMANANGAVPGTLAAIRRSKWYGPDGPLHLFTQQLTGGYAVPRPRTPGYPVITALFQRAFADIRAGADVQQTLDRAAARIDEDIRDNKGYRPPH